MLSRFRPWHAALVAAILLGFAGFLYVIGPGAATPPRPFVREAAGKAVPDVGFADGAGVRHTLAAYRGRYVLLNLWATWCAPCVRELPALAALQKAAPGLTVLAVDVDSDVVAQQTGEYLRQHGAENLGVYLDDEKVFIKSFKAYGLPLTILIDRQGREIGQAEGAVEWDSERSVTYFRRLSGGK